MSAAILNGYVVNTGDYVVARPYPATKDGQRIEARHFIGRAKILHIWQEERRDLGNGKLYPHTRLTVLCEDQQRYGFQRRDVLARLVEIWEPLAPILTAQQMAEAAYPAFNWQRYNELEHEAAEIAKQKSYRNCSEKTRPAAK